PCWHCRRSKCRRHRRRRSPRVHPPTCIASRTVATVPDPAGAAAAAAAAAVDVRPKVTPPARAARCSLDVMRRRHRAGVSLLLLCSGAALAHVPLRHSPPPDGARLAASPAALTLSFSEPTQLTALSLQQEQGPSWKLSAPAEAQLRVSVPLPPLAP